MTQKEKMLSGEWFESNDPQLSEERHRAEQLLLRLNASTMQSEEYRAVFRELFPHVAEGTMIRPSFFCDYGYNLYMGEGGFVNYNCVMLDGAPIRIGKHVLIGPAVQIYTFIHPMDYRQRREPVEACRPVTIGDDCWIGGGAVICPGVTIGERTVIGAGSVVTKDVPSDVVAVGNPARILRRL